MRTVAVSSGRAIDLLPPRAALEDEMGIDWEKRAKRVPQLLRFKAAQKRKLKRLTRKKEQKQ